MNRTEQRERLGDILDLIQDLKSELKDKIEPINKATSKIEELDDIMNDIGEVSSWDSEELINSLTSTILEESMQEVSDQLYDFQNDLHEYMSELSDNKLEKLEDRYINLEDVRSKFSNYEQEYDSIENALEHIEEAEIMIKEMKK